jgi:hypothetical protein
MKEGKKGEKSNVSLVYFPDKRLAMHVFTFSEVLLRPLLGRV